MLRKHTYVIVDLRQKPTKQKVSHENHLQVCRLHSSYNANVYIIGTVKEHLINNRRMEIDHGGVLTVTAKTRPNTFGSDRPTEETRPLWLCNVILMND